MTRRLLVMRALGSTTGAGIGAACMRGSHSPTSAGASQPQAGSHPHAGSQQAADSQPQAGSQLSQPVSFLQHANNFDRRQVLFYAPQPESQPLSQAATSQPQAGASQPQAGSQPLSQPLSQPPQRPFLPNSFDNRPPQCDESPQAESQPLSQAATSQPQAGASQPQTGSQQAADSQPQAGASHPQAGSQLAADSQPQAGASHPQAGSARGVATCGVAAARAAALNSKHSIQKVKPIALAADTATKNQGQSHDCPLHWSHVSLSQFGGLIRRDFQIHRKPE